MNTRDTRDMFASQAMTGLLTVGEFNFNKADEIAHDAYKLADAMMAERKKHDLAKLHAEPVEATSELVDTKHELEKVWSKYRDAQDAIEELERKIEFDMVEKTNTSPNFNQIRVGDQIV